MSDYERGLLRGWFWGIVLLCGALALGAAGCVAEVEETPQMRTSASGEQLRWSEFPVAVEPGLVGFYPLNKTWRTGQFFLPEPDPGQVQVTWTTGEPSVALYSEGAEIIACHITTPDPGDRCGNAELFAACLGLQGQTITNCQLTAEAVEEVLRWR